MKQAAHIRRAQELLTAPALGDTKRFGHVIVDASGKIVGGGWPPRERMLEPQYPPPPGIIIENVLIAVRLGKRGEKRFMEFETRQQPLDIKKTGRIFIKGIREEMQKGKSVQIGRSGESCSSCISQIHLDNEGNEMTQIFTDIKCNKMPSESEQDLIAGELEYALLHSIFDKHNFETYHKFNGVNQINPDYILNKKKVGFSVTAMNSLMI